MDDYYFELIVDKFKQEYIYEKIITIDGIKIEKEKHWFHIRRSNTEPIVRVYAESSSLDEANLLAQEIINKIKKI